MDIFNQLDKISGNKSDNELDNEARVVNEIYDLVNSEGGLISKDDIKKMILEQFSKNAQTILSTKGTPLSVFIDTISAIGQMNAGSLKKIVSTMLYTQSSGDDLTLNASNFGHSRIEAKTSNVNIIVTSDKDITIDPQTSFTDANGTIWLSQKTANLKKNIPTRIGISSRDVGAITIVSPLSPTNPISGVVSVEIEEKSLVVGRYEETDAELRATIASGFNIQGTDNSVMRALLQLQMVNSAFAYTNPTDKSVTLQDVEISPLQRYITLRLSSVDLSSEEADLIALTILNNTIYKANFQRPANNKVRAYFGISEETLKKPLNQGGAGIESVDKDSNAILVRRVTEIYNNYVDIYFYLALPIEVDILLYITYKNGAYTNSAKENLNGELRKEISAIIAQIARVGKNLMISDIIFRIKQETQNKIDIDNMYIRKHGTTDKKQVLIASPYQYFLPYSNTADPYAGIIVTEGADAK